MRNRVRIIIYVCIACFFVLAFAGTARHDSESEVETLTNAVEQDVSAYYARNGYYPDSVDVLRKEYGLTWDADRYFIGYDLRGANIRPYIKVVKLGEQS